MIHGHGDNSHYFGKEIRADFSSNVRPDGCPQLLLDHLSAQMPLIQHYPEPDGERLRKLIAEKHSLSPTQVILCNGSSDGFYLIAQAFEGNSSAVLAPAFAEYADACCMFGHSLSFFSAEDFSALNETELVWIGNPNNPDGHVFSVSEIETKLNTLPNTVLVVDEAYIDFCTGTQSTVSLLKEHNNLIICRSLTKSYAIPGLRLGYLLTSEEIASLLNRYLRPWSVNALALEAGLFILKEEKDLAADFAQFNQLSRNLQQQIAALSNFEVVPSNTNFFLVRIKNGQASELQKFLIEKHGLLIRDASNFIGLNESWFRISIQNEEKNADLVDALREWINK